MISQSASAVVAQDTSLVTAAANGHLCLLARTPLTVTHSVHQTTVIRPALSLQHLLPLRTTATLSRRRHRLKAALLVQIRVAALPRHRSTAARPRKTRLRSFWR